MPNHNSRSKQASNSCLTWRWFCYYVDSFLALLHLKLQLSKSCFQNVKWLKCMVQTRLVPFVLLVSENSRETISYILAAVRIGSFRQSLHKSAGKIRQKVLLVSLHSDTNWEVVKVLFFITVVAYLPINFKFIGEIKGENTVLIDLENYWKII